MMAAVKLARLRNFFSSDQSPVVSLYLNVDGAHLPTRSDFENEFSFLAHEARKIASDDIGLSRDQESRLESELAAIGQYLSLEFKRNGARSVAIFSCRDEDLYEVIPVGLPLKNRVYVGFRPYIAPLSEALSVHDRFLVMVINKETTRIFEAYAGEISELSGSLDPVLKRHNQGGWEQAKLQRRHELQVRNHLKKAVDTALGIFQSESFDRFALGIADELWPEMEKTLHSYLKDKMAGRFAIDINAPADEILERVARLESEQKENEDRTLLESLEPELKGGHNFAGGLDDVLAALNERRIETLLVENGFAAPGAVCAVCQTVAAGGGEGCPSCGKPMVTVANVIDEARELAVRQDAQIKTVAGGNEAIAQAGHVAARLRY